MSKKMTPEEKAAKAAAKKAGVKGDQTLVETGKVFIVEFDHSYDDSVMGPDGHSKATITTVHHVREYPNQQLAEAVAKKFPGAKITKK